EREVAGDELPEHRGVDGMTHPAVRALGDQLVALDEPRFVAPLPAERAHGGEADRERGERQQRRQEVKRDLQRVEPRTRGGQLPLDHPHQRERQHLECDAHRRDALALRPLAARLAAEHERDGEPRPPRGHEQPGDERERREVGHVYEHGLGPPRGSMGSASVRVTGSRPTCRGAATNGRREPPDGGLPLGRRRVRAYTPANAPRRSRTRMKVRYCIVGGGAAAVAAIEGIRSHDKSGDILLLSRENHRPYRRPLLTKDLWYGTAT